MTNYDVRRGIPEASPYGPFGGQLLRLVALLILCGLGPKAEQLWDPVASQ